MTAEFEPARTDDVEELHSLFHTVYGGNYAMPYGTDKDVMAAEIAADTTTWLVHRARGRIVATVLAQVAPQDRMAKMQGLVVHPEARGNSLARSAVGALSEDLLADDGIDSAYGTARTIGTAPQRIMLANGFHGLGILPNIRKAGRHETMALLLRHREGVLELRSPVDRVPAALRRIVLAVERTIGLPKLPEFVPANEYAEFASDAKIELVDAPSFVRRTFDLQVRDPYRRFYPFHQPNVLLTEESGAFDLYAHMSRRDGYCTIVGATPSGLALAPHLEPLITLLNASGALYLETIVPLHAFEELSALLAHGFLPAAMYPAMRREDRVFHDYVVMTRTMEPLDFRGLAIDKAFRPYVEQYIDLWTQRHLDTSGVFR
ncbi:GNAT family N-acetyltransferase [Amycolatopsis sp. SID8362]|uniref:GNAT family N-acetyltransferase n=1 Tax=Amycolatopsis sp. SID8362 TaxID=2690346 RepID=UPI001369780D|nr:GNAT family N-acetyltransferase [Amycolatopsis sp. SID8362]NBH06074.1 N-acetyltransferase [Amycolatopsis sp. SID8362]NED42773.1 N-acetyltransferase [Amycolatopsis sp. SID8362]